MDRFTILRFSTPCVSLSSVAVCENQNQPTKQQTDCTMHTTEKAKSAFGALALPKLGISTGFQKMMKSLSHLVYKEEEADMEIGLPTDVLHVAHIGCDGFSNTMNGLWLQ
ncbi:CRIB domain-containing protein RIC4-like [Curcuma longa]|uniref:CRIB domain-containing protein RIC4-like n=1 Tax=Curcuma longa TaxID=136217 RepID=UPI003D9DEFA3